MISVKIWSGIANSEWSFSIRTKLENTKLKNFIMSYIDCGFILLFHILTPSISFFLLARSTWFFFWIRFRLLSLYLTRTVFVRTAVYSGLHVRTPPICLAIHLLQSFRSASERFGKNPSTRPPQNNHPGPASESVHEMDGRNLVFGSLFTIIVRGRPSSSVETL